MSHSFKIAIAGLGTVGAGTVRLIQKNAEILRRRSGKTIEITAISARSQKNRGFDTTGVTWYADAVEMARETDADLVMELIGGHKGAAKEVVETALKRGKHVITANKMLLAYHGNDLARLAEERGVCLAYEAAIAGGIPIVKGLREGLAANQIGHVYGILNGTCNYILSNMEETGRDFGAVLKEAQRLGYAEAEPGADVDGFDSAHKLALLSSLAFGTEVNYDDLYVEGIRNVTSADIGFAAELGMRIKLLGSARLHADGRVSQRVHPCMITVGEPIAMVDGVVNVVVCNGDPIGRAVFEGPGAGAGPTASAVVADLVDIVRGARTPTFGMPVVHLNKAENAPIDNHAGIYYLRTAVEDTPGALDEIFTQLREHSVSVKTSIQSVERAENGLLAAVVTQPCLESDIQAAILRVDALGSVKGKTHMIRIVSL